MASNLQIPIAIVIAGAIVAGAVLYSNSGTSNIQAAGGHGAQMEGGDFGNNNSAAATNVRKLDERDHVLGGADAKVVIVEYSDFECPFCSRFHPTLSRIVDDFGGEVAWVYRHFPLTQIHSRAQRAAVASECVAELGGNDAFWKFGDELFKSQRSLNDDLYITAAGNLGVGANVMRECLDSGRHEQKVTDDTNNAIESGGRGTPFTVVINEKGEVFPFSGALPYENVRSIVETALES